jgi:hypothetical protein
MVGKDLTPLAVIVWSQAARNYQAGNPATNGQAF